MSKRVGIDLGTTNSAIAAAEDGDPSVLTNAEGGRTTPSVVHFESADSFVVGEPARPKKISKPETTVSQVKRHIGKDGWTTAPIHGETYTPEDVSSLVLQKLVTDGADRLNDEIERAVITVPAYFGEPEREATKNAGELAGLDVMQVINEPTAACLAYGLGKDDTEMELAFVYDFGGGTFDASLVEIGGGAVEVLATNGDEHLGGCDIDEALYDHLRIEFQEQGNPDPATDLTMESALLEEAKAAKEALSSQQTYEIDQPHIGPEPFSLSITREMFDEAVAGLVDETIDVVDDLFDEVSRTVDAVDEVLLVGGSTRIPLVERRVEAYFGQQPSKEINPDEAVAIGASVQAAIGADGGGGTGEQAKKLLPGGSEDLVLFDVLSKSLGIRLHDGSFDPILERNEQIPAFRSKRGYTTKHDNQTSVQVKIYEGEHELAEENRLLGEFPLDGIEPQPAGVPSIEIEFEIDESGILHAEATDLDSDHSEDITIEDVFMMTDAEIEARRKDLPVYQGDAR
ncbi:Hsp70 family protein [Natrialbaceae archaeon A-arb3/5]